MIRFYTIPINATIPTTVQLDECAVPGEELPVRLHVALGVRVGGEIHAGVEVVLQLPEAPHVDRGQRDRHQDDNHLEHGARLLCEVTLWAFVPYFIEVRVISVRQPILP